VACQARAAAHAGDRTFALRRHTALPLAREGAAALILESPFYGGLRPAPRAPRPARRRAALMRARAGLNLSPKPKLRTKLKPGLEPCTRRKPAGQRGPKLRRVVDLLALGNATIEVPPFSLPAPPALRFPRFLGAISGRVR
jgi:hypothetical protein